MAAHKCERQRRRDTHVPHVTVHRGGRGTRHIIRGRIALLLLLFIVFLLAAPTHTSAIALRGGHSQRFIGKLFKQRPPDSKAILIGESGQKGEQGAQGWKGRYVACELG
jgi:hypothetical protein